MRVLLETDLIDIIAPLSDAEKLQIFDCLLHYPDKDCDVGAWRFMRKQIDRDQAAYQNRKKGLSVARANRWAKQSEQIGSQSDDLTPAIAVSNSNSINNNNGSNNVSALIKKLANNFSPDKDKKYEIAHDFSFAELLRRDASLAQILSMYSEPVLLKTERALREKCMGKQFTFAAIIKWVEEQSKH
ncbi:MAG: hypothetical protein LBL75_00660 [Rickettsiales bacterium]|jgi:hypothetical protein|nr:hypothetical protein [Rickettsiales bacterium]